MHLHLLGRWRVVFFTGDIRDLGQRQKLEAVGQAVDAKSSFLRRFTPPGASHDTIFEILAVHSAPRTETSIFDFPKVFRHFDDVQGYDYWKIYVDDMSYHEGHGKIYETFGISSKGCAVVIRPDQYVSYIGPMEDVGRLNEFFAGFMIPRASKELSGDGDIEDISGEPSQAAVPSLNNFEAKAADTRAF